MVKPPRQNRIREALDRIYDQHPPQVREYVRRYQEDPKSRVFAPLAEAYRRLGRVDEAMGLCLEGLENHPGFHGGRVALAKCYIDKREFEKARAELEKVVQSAPENLLAQRLLGDTLLSLGLAHQALHCFKMAVMLAPSDVLLEEKMRAIEGSCQKTPREAESRVVETGTLVLQESNPNVAMPVAQAEAPQVPCPSLWEMDSPVTDSKSSLEAIHEESVSWGETDPFIDSLPDSQTIEKTLGSADIEESFQVQNVSDLFKETSGAIEITTSTLADLYLSQGQFEMSLRMYEKLLLRDPSNESLKKKILTCRRHLGAEDGPRDRRIEVLRSVLNRVKDRRASDTDRSP